MFEDTIPGEDYRFEESDQSREGYELNKPQVANIKKDSISRIPALRQLPPIISRIARRSKVIRKQEGPRHAACISNDFRDCETTLIGSRGDIYLLERGGSGKHNGIQTVQTVHNTSEQAIGYRSRYSGLERLCIEGNSEPILDGNQSRRRLSDQSGWKLNFSKLTQRENVNPST
jgi:hypothetical protein